MLSTKSFRAGMPGAMSCHSGPAWSVHFVTARGELGAVVADDDRRAAAPSDQGVELADHASAADRGFDDKGQRLSGVVVDERQDPEAPGPGQPAGQAVGRPALVRRPDRWSHGDGIPSPSSLPPPAHAARR
ncbi:MAG: hypothetical protein RID91_01010 [Azospirillaceae bacterium]